MRAHFTAIALHGRPRVRARLEAMVSEPGVTLAQLERELHAHGIHYSRSAVQRWAASVRNRAVGTSGALLAQVIGRVIALDEAEIKALAKRLGVKGTKP